MADIQSTVLQRQAPIRATYRKRPEQALITKRARTQWVGGADPWHGAVIPGDADGGSQHYGIDRAVGGYHDAPNPGELLCAALAACKDATVRMVADALGVILEQLEVEVTGRVDVRGSLGMDPDTPVRFQTVTCEVRLRVAPGTPPAAVERLLAGAECACINLATLRRGVPVKVDFTVDGGERQAPPPMTP